MQKRILYIVPLPPPVHGVSVMSEYAYGSQLIRSEFECAVLPLRFTSSVSEIGSFGMKKLWLMVNFCFQLIVKLIRFRPHLVYFTLSPVGSAFYRDALFCTIIKSFGVQILLHLHGKGIQAAATSSSLKKAIYRYTFRKSEVIILAKSLATDLSPVFDGTPYVLPNGIPTSTDQINKEVTPTPSFLYLSNLVRSKGIEIFLYGIQQLNKKNIAFKARIVGALYDVSLEEINRFIDENKLTSKTEILGPLYGKEKQEILSQSDILVFPTYYQNEAFPLTILEAMREGLAVVASNNGAIPEMVDDGRTGFVIPMKDLAATTEKMELLAEDATLRMEMGRKGREKFAQFYTIELFERNLFEIFKQVIK
jgi:glycosyltransferase involved in cell wall biosynthesis